MKIKSKKYRYAEWLSATEMHENSKELVSELKFIIDEQLFLNNLVKSYTSQLVDSNVYQTNKEVIDDILTAEKKIKPLIAKIQLHQNQLEVMIDDTDQLEMEKAYIETHRELLTAMDDYSGKYRSLKEKLFKIISNIIKKEKQKRLLN
ncbi:hypothetical protein MTsPCn9_29480 [Croceitalea sp. MTPC9]|uniref:hypothetical protein n=1 Tax=unclassified Croceitalea TaxID=2632280 RepID=UPI002B3A8311|nr:hypothetical protein MTsPCn6_30970 [Croceitalea sp. MTPC6]GMN18008.1 hypothetical protein MTsPCn9_29480 [Croceitalea sp. MTPC9]